MNTTFLIFITAPLFVVMGIILTALTAHTFVHRNNLSKVIARIKLYPLSLRLAWMIETMVNAGNTKAAQRKLVCKNIVSYCLKNMDEFKNALDIMGVKYTITAQPSHYATTRSLLDSQGNQRTIFITIIDSNKCFGIGFLIMVSYLLIKELHISSTFNNTPLNIVFCTARMVKDGEFHDWSIASNFHFTGNTDLYTFFTHFYEGANKLNKDAYDLFVIETFVTRLSPMFEAFHKLPDQIT